jgi:hypothetical protein
MIPECGWGTFFLNLGSQVRALLGTPFSKQLMVDGNARRWTRVQPGDATKGLEAR